MILEVIWRRPVVRARRQRRVAGAGRRRGTSSRTGGGRRTTSGLRFSRYKTTTPMEDYAENEWSRRGGRGLRGREPPRDDLPESRAGASREGTGRDVPGVSRRAEDVSRCRRARHRRGRRRRRRRYDRASEEAPVHPRPHLRGAAKHQGESPQCRRMRWEAGGRLLPGFLAIRKKEEKS